MKINRDKLSKLFARFGLIIMSFVIMIPMLCSASAPTKIINVTIQNPDNIPQDIDFSLGADTSFALNFGDNVVDSFLVSVLDSSFALGSFEFITDVPDGDYYYVEIQAVQPSGYSNSLVCNGNTYTVTSVGFLEYPVTVYVTGNPVITVIESTESFTSINIPVLIPVTPTLTESITNVWTGIMNWITSTLNSVQGLFITRGGDPDPTLLNAGTYRLNDVLTNPFNENLTTLSSDLNAVGTASISSLNYTGITTITRLSFGIPIVDGELSYGDLILNVTISDLDPPNANIPTPFPATVYYNGWKSAEYGNQVNSFTLLNDQEVSYEFGTYFIENSNYNEVNGYGQSSLTLLGTLAVIGVSISICFLLIGIIQRFLRLRG